MERALDRFEAVYSLCKNNNDFSQTQNLANIAEESPVDALSEDIKTD